MQNIQGKGGTFVMDKGNRCNVSSNPDSAKARRGIGGAKAAGIPLDTLDRMLEEEYRKK